MRMLWLPESWLNVAAPPNPHRKKKRKKAGVKAIPPAVHLVVRKRRVLSDHFLISKRSFYQDRLGTNVAKTQSRNTPSISAGKCAGAPSHGVDPSDKPFFLVTIRGDDLPRQALDTSQQEI
jgi:hypothetical protein